MVDALMGFNLQPIAVSKCNSVSLRGDVQWFHTLRGVKIWAENVLTSNATANSLEKVSSNYQTNRNNSLITITIVLFERTLQLKEM